MKKFSINLLKVGLLLIIGLFMLGMNSGVNATAKEVDRLKITVLEDLEYYLDEEFDVSEFSVIAVYDDGSEEDITDKLEVESPKMDELGEHEVVFNYENMKFALTIKVVEAPVESIEEPEDIKDEEPEEIIVEPEDKEDEKIEEIKTDVNVSKFQETVGGIMSFIQPIIDMIINNILPMVMNTILPMATNAATTILPVAVDAAKEVIPILVTAVGGLF